MAKQPSPFRSAVAAGLICAFAAPAAGAEAPTRSYRMVVDGTPSRAVPGFFNGAHTMVALEPFARDLRYLLTRDGSRRQLHAGTEVYTFGPGDSTVFLNGEPLLQLTSMPEVRGSSLFIALEDLQSILSQDIETHDGAIEIAGAAPPESVHAAPLSRPRVSNYTVRSDSGSGVPANGRAARPSSSSALANDTKNALVIRLAVSSYGGSGSKGVSLLTEGTRIRGNMDASSFGGSAPVLSGQIAVGTPSAYVQAGGQENPLNGLFFNAPGGFGFGGRHANEAFGTEHDASGRTVAAWRREQENGATYYGFIKSAAGWTPVLGWRQSRDGIVKYTQETWLTSGGAGASVALATQGRVFGELTASLASSGMPLVAGEAPDRVNLGYRIADGVTLRAGLTSGFRLGISPFFGFSYNGKHGLGTSLQFAGSSRNATITYAGSEGSASAAFSASPGEAASWAIDATTNRGAHAFEVQAFHSATSEDDVVRSRLLSGPGLILGVERIVNNGKTRVGPLFGFTLPLGRTNAFELTEHPTGGGRAVSFAFTHRIAFDPAVHTRALALRGADISELYVDGRAMRAIGPSTKSAALPPGSHNVQARSTNGLSASLPQTVDDSTGAVDVTLLPVRQVSGRIAVPGEDPAGRKISLEHISVQLEPGGEIAETSPDGTFVFPPFPVAPDARVSIIADSLPAELKPLDDAPASAVPLILAVKTKVAVRRKKF